MGNSAFLQQPITDKKTTFEQNSKFRVSICEMQGWRRYMEDSFIAHLSIPQLDDISLFGVFDGHGGAESAKYVAKHFLQCFVKRQTLKEGKIGQALKETFIHVQLMMKMKPAIKELIQFKKEVTKMNNITEQDLQSGCTAIVVAITKDKIYCANAGDSRAALCRKNKVEPLSQDHKPENPVEKQRIEKAGSQIIGGRVNGLNLTRSIGDFGHKNTPGLPFHKQPITCMPDIKQIDREEGDQFLLIGCDGVWQKSGEDFSMITEEMREQLDKKQKANVPVEKRGLEVLAEFFDRNINPNNTNPYGRDNMTALMVEFKS